MNRPRHRIALLAGTSLAVLLMIGCQPSPSTPTDSQPAADAAPQTALGRAVQKAMEKSRREMLDGNIDITDVRSVSIGEKQRDHGKPKAELTPQGDLLIDGVAVPINPAQRQLLLDYRGQVIGLAEAGMRTGLRGADLAMKALGEAARGIISGNPDQIEARVEAEAESLKTEAEGICRLLQPLRETQQALAASLPQFQPYATLEAGAIEQCLRDVREGESDAAAAHAENSAIASRVGEEIRQGIGAAVATAISGGGAASSSSSSHAGVHASASVNGVRFLLPPGAVSVQSGNGHGSIEAGGVHVQLSADALQINGQRYAVPAQGAEVDLRQPGKVLVDGKQVAAR